jgi:hypothetical protein
MHFLRVQLSIGTAVLVPGYIVSTRYVLPIILRQGVSNIGVKWSKDRNPFLHTGGYWGVINYMRII